MASAPRSGRGGRPFESDHPDKFIQIVSAQHFAGLFCIPTQTLSEPDFRPSPPLGSTRLHSDCGIKTRLPEPKQPPCTPFRGFLGTKTGISNPIRPSRWPPGLNFSVPEPKQPSCTPFQGHPGIKSRLSEPAGTSELALWLKIAYFNPVCPSQPTSDSLPGLKSRLSEPAGTSRCPRGINFGVPEPNHPL